MREEDLGAMLLQLTMVGWVVPRVLINRASLARGRESPLVPKQVPSRGPHFMAQPIIIQF